MDFTDQNESTEVTNLKSNGDTNNSVNANGGSNSHNKNGGVNGKPIPRAKPKAAKRTSPNSSSSSKHQPSPGQQLTSKQQLQLNKGRIANSTEYAQIAFSDKTDL